MKSNKTFVILLLVVSLAVAIWPHEGVAGPIAFNLPNLVGQDVYLANSDGSNLHRIPLPGDLLSADGPVWSRDGTRLAASGIITGGPGQVLVVFDPAGSQVLVPFPPGGNLPVSSFALFKAFSPDGTRLAFANIEPNFAEFGIINLVGPTMNVLPGISLVDVSPVMTVTNTDGMAGIGIDWSPRNSNLLVTSIPQLGSGIPVPVTGLVLFDLSTGRLTSLTFPMTPDPISFQVSDIFPVFAPDGIHVAFVRWIQGLAGLPSKTEIWITDGRTERRVVQSPQFFTSITWSPDGTRLLFSLANLLFSQPLAVGFINADATGLQLFQAPVSSLSWSMAL